MLRRTLFLTAMVFAGFVAQAASQELAGNKIPRRVYFAPAVIGNGAQEPLLRKIPSYLYTEISARQPIVRVDTPESANSVIRVSVGMPGPSVEVRLFDKGVEVTKVSFVSDNFTDLARYVKKTAADLAPHLGFVSPTVRRIETNGRTAGNEALIQKVRPLDRFARPIEISIDGVGFMRFLPGEVPVGQAFGFEPLPIVFRFTYFPSRSLGFDGSLLTYFGSRLTFGQASANTSSPLTRSLLLLPGIGVKYRSPGTIFASLSATLYAGYGYVTNISSQSIGSYRNGRFQLFLTPGTSTSIFYSLMRFASDIGYNISPHLALRTGVALDLSPNIFFNSGPFGYPSQGNSFFIQYLTLGFSYRP
jgi:hypothetical protein